MDRSSTAKRIGKDLTVAIVTKNREYDLLECLNSLAAQTIPLHQLIVIDNDSKDNTKDRVRKFAASTGIPTKIVTESKEGFGAVYNRALLETNTRWIAFIDDDCVANRGWHAALLAAIGNSHEDTAVVLGKSETYWKNSFPALVMAFNIYLWTRMGIGDDGKVIDYAVLDNKNIAYDVHFLKQHRLGFRKPESKEFAFLFGEDADLGIRIGERGGKAIYNPTMYVRHKDPKTWREVIRKLRFSGRSFQVRETEWRMNKQSGLVHQQIPRNTRNEIIRFGKEYNLPAWKTYVLAGMLYAVWILLKLR